MNIETRLNDALKEAMRARDSDRVACIRQLRSKVQEAQNAPGFQGPADDAFYQRVITSYVKSLEKGIAELLAAGERGEALRARYQAEIDYLKPYLPQQMSEAQTRALVQRVIAETGAASKKQAGQVVGAVMKQHKGEVDAALVRRLVDELLPA